MMHRALSQPCPPAPTHYFDSAEALLRMQAEGRSLAEIAHFTGLTIPQINARLPLTALEPALRGLLRHEGVPEEIARVLVELPDPLSRRRMALRIIQERLCIRDAALLVQAALRKTSVRAEPPRQRVIAVIRDVRPYRNAIQDIAEQMKTAGVRATFTERKTGGMQEMTVSYPARRRRVERFHSM